MCAGKKSKFIDHLSDKERKRKGKPKSSKNHRCLKLLASLFPNSTMGLFPPKKNPIIKVIHVLWGEKNPQILKKKSKAIIVLPNNNHHKCFSVYDSIHMYV